MVLHFHLHIDKSYNSQYSWFCLTVQVQISTVTRDSRNVSHRITNKLLVQNLSKLHTLPDAKSSVKAQKNRHSYMYV